MEQKHLGAWQFFEHQQRKSRCITELWYRHRRNIYLLSKNIFGNDTIEYELYKVLQSSVYPTTQYTAADGEEAVLACPFEVYNSIEWFNCTTNCQELRTNDEISITNESKDLKIHRARSHRTGMYRCKDIHDGIISVNTLRY